LGLTGVPIYNIISCGHFVWLTAARIFFFDQRIWFPSTQSRAAGHDLPKKCSNLAVNESIPFGCFLLLVGRVLQQRGRSNRITSSQLLCVYVIMQTSRLFIISSHQYTTESDTRRRRSQMAHSFLSNTHTHNVCVLYRCLCIYLKRQQPPDTLRNPGGGCPCAQSCPTSQPFSSSSQKV
jgi:hypothetical protein